MSNQEPVFQSIRSKQGISSVELDPEIGRYTAFVTQCGLYEWVHTPFRLINSPACFQRFFEHCLEDITDDFAIPCPGDLLIFSATFDNHIQQLLEVLECLWESMVIYKFNFTLYLKFHTSGPTIFQPRYNDHQKIYSTMVFLIWRHLCRVHFHSFRSLTSGRNHYLS